jgi:hypothetical protein
MTVNNIYYFRKAIGVNDIALIELVPQIFAYSNIFHVYLFHLFSW